MSKGGKTGGGPQPSAPGILPGGGPLTSSSPGKGGRQQPSGPIDRGYGGWDNSGGMRNSSSVDWTGGRGTAGPPRDPLQPSGPGKGGRGMPPQPPQQFGGGWGQPQQFGGRWGQPQFQGGFGGYGQGLQRPSGPGKGGPFQGPGPSYNQPQMPFGYGQMQYSPQRFGGYGVPSSMAQPFPDIQLPPPGYPQQYGRQPGMGGPGKGGRGGGGGPGKGGRRRGPPPYMGGPVSSPEYQELLAERQRSRGQNEGVNERLRIMQQQQQQQREEYGQAGGYAQMLRKLGRPGGQYTPSQADEPFWTSAYSGGGGIAGIYGPGGRVR